MRDVEEALTGVGDSRIVRPAGFLHDDDAKTGGSSPETAESMSPNSPRLLIVMLLLRAGLNAAFAAWLVGHAGAWAGIFRVGATFAIADGLAGLVTALLLVRHAPSHAPPLLRSLTFADAALRLAAGILLLAFPAIADLPILIVWFFAAMGACAALLGVSAAAGWLLARVGDKRAGRSWSSGTHELFDPLAAGGLLALVVAGCALAFGPPSSAVTLRAVTAALCGGLAVVFVVSAIGAGGTREL